MNVSAFCLTAFGEVIGGAMVGGFPVLSALDPRLGVCGRERSYDSCGVGVLVAKSIAMSSYFRFDAS